MVRKSAMSARLGAEVDGAGDGARAKQQPLEGRLGDAGDQGGGPVLAWDDGALGAALDAADDPVDDGVELDGLEGAREVLDELDGGGAGQRVADHRRAEEPRV